MSAPDPMARLEEELEGVLALLGRSLLLSAASLVEQELRPAVDIEPAPPLVYDPGPMVAINNDTQLTAKPENPKLYIRVEELIRILRNSSQNSARIAKYIHALIHHAEPIEWNGDYELHGPPERVHSVERWAVTMRDSLAQSAQILEGHDLDTEHEDLHPARTDYSENVQPAHLDVSIPTQGNIYMLAKDISSICRRDNLSKEIIIKAERIMQTLNPDYTPSIGSE